MSRPACHTILVKILVFACLSLAGVDRAGAQEAADPVDVSFHLDDASLPDPVRSPGGTSPDVTTEDLCETPAADFASAPPASLCDEVFAEHRISTDHRFQYRCGFLVPPTIGGSDARRNVWLQPTNEAALKQAVDAEARKDVCRHGIALKEAQTLMARDWVGLYRKFFRPNDKLLPIAKTERAASSFDGPPPAQVLPGASPRAYLDNPGPGGSLADSSPYAGDPGSGGPADDRRRHRRLRDGNSGPNGRPIAGTRADARTAGPDRNRPLRDEPDGRVPDGRDGRIGLDRQPGAAGASRDRSGPEARQRFGGREPRPMDEPRRSPVAQAHSRYRGDALPARNASSTAPRMATRQPRQILAPQRFDRSGARPRLR